MAILGKLRQALVARYRTGVVFTHIQKCGGSSLEAALFRHYRLSRERIYPNEARAAERLSGLFEVSTHVEFEALDLRKALLAYALARDVKCVTGHNPVNAAIIDAHKNTHKFITVLRDPIDRFCSHFRYNFRSGLATAIDDPLDDFLATDRARWFGSVYATFFGSAPPVIRDGERSYVDEAKRVLDRYDLVGFIDDMDGFERRLGALLGANIRIGHENRTSYRETHWGGEITDDQRARIRDRCRPNYEIYEHARARFARG